MNCIRKIKKKIWGLLLFAGALIFMASFKVNGAGPKISLVLITDTPYEYRQDEEVRKVYTETIGFEVNLEENPEENLEEKSEERPEEKIEEETPVFEDFTVALTLQNYSGEEIWTEIYEPSDFMQKEGVETKVLRGELELEDGFYTLHLAMTDSEENPLEESSVSFIVDKTAPVIRITDRLERKDNRIESEDQDFCVGGSLEIEVEELTLTTELSNLLSGEGVENAEILWTEERNPVTGLAVYTAVLKFTEGAFPDGVYDLLIEAADAAGQISSELKAFIMDSTAPKLRVEYEPSNPQRSNLDGVDYFNQEVIVKVLVEEAYFDPELFEMMVTESDAKGDSDIETDWQEQENCHMKTFTFCEDRRYDLVFKGEDYAGNSLQLLPSESAAIYDPQEDRIFLAVAIDTQPPVITRIQIISPEHPSGKSQEGEALYNTDVTYEVEISDPMKHDFASGIYAVTMEVTGEDGATSGCTVDRFGNILDGDGVSVEKIGNGVGKPGQSAANSERFLVTVGSEVFHTNGIVLTVNTEDRAANRAEEAKTSPISIDVTAPKVTVSYDHNEVSNEKYFRASRTATVSVTDRNFDNDCLQFFVNGNDAKLDFSLKEESVWTAAYAFTADDEYHVETVCRDLAGNEGTVEYLGEAPQNFIIDQTTPVITVEYDNYEVQNGYYYKKGRRALITIKEKNFSAEDVKLVQTVTNSGQEIMVPIVSGWSEEGEFHRAVIDYNYDGEITLAIGYTDLALNPAESYGPDYFVIDQTAPTLEIFDILHRSANNGEVRPGIRCRDVNYDRQRTAIALSGVCNGAHALKGTKSETTQELELKLDDFPYTKDSDDLYTLSASVCDLAGNRVEKTVNFSVNRFGSVYTFDEKTEKLAGPHGSYYTNREQDLVITETNVDSLKFQEITCNLNGKLTILREGSDYTVQTLGSDDTWKQYRYVIAAKNFSKEGTYIVTIFSEDKATNLSDNNSKGKRIEFAVDKTAPSILISGVKNEGQYRVTNQEMTVDVEEQLCLSRVEIEIDGVKTEYGEAKLREMGGRIVQKIESADHWQKLRVIAEDAAGNHSESEIFSVLVTDNLLIQFYENKPLFYGSLGGTALLGILLWKFMKDKKRPKIQVL